MARRTATAGLVLSLVTMPGCYSGLDRWDHQGGLDDAGPGAEGEDDAGDDDGEDEPEAQCSGSGVGNQPLRRLTSAQYDNVVRDLLGDTSRPASVFAADERLGAFLSNGVAPVSHLMVEQYMNVAETLAATAVEDLDALLPCDPGVVGEDACAEDFVASFGRRALRRPLQAEELEMFYGVYLAGRDEGTFADGIRLAVQALLQSPYFLYHVELGDPTQADDLKAPLTQFEIASRLSFFLWSSMPDDALLDAAQAQQLGTPEQISEQAERMLDDPRARDTITSFHLQWLGIDQLDGLEKDAEMFPELDDALRQAMQAETAGFANWVVLEGDGRLETLLTSSVSVIDGPLFELYGVERPADHVAGDPVQLDPEQRAGLLTHAGWLAKNAHIDQSSPVHRGVTVRERVLCQNLPLPPDNANDVPPDPDPNATTRERFAEHTENPECAACHLLIDGIGFGFESYDAIGQFRTMEGSLPVDASGDVIGTTDANGPFDGAVELAQRLATSEDVRQCVSQQWFNFALGRVPGEDDACSTEQIHQAFVDSDYDVRELMLAIVRTDAFRFRRLAAE